MSYQEPGRHMKLSGKTTNWCQYWDKRDVRITWQRCSSSYNKNIQWTVMNTPETNEKVSAKKKRKSQKRSRIYTEIIQQMKLKTQWMSKMEGIEKRISKLEDRIIEITQSL